MIVVKNLKVRGATSSLKVGTKVRNIRLVDGDHNIDCKISPKQIPRNLMQISSLVTSCLAVAVSTMQAHPQTTLFPTEGRGSPRVEQLGTSVDQMIYEFMETERVPGLTLALWLNRPQARSTLRSRAIVTLLLSTLVLIAGCSNPLDNVRVIVPAQVQPVAKTSVRMEPFSGFIGGRWKMTTLAGTDTYDTWHWGPERNSIRSMSRGMLPNGEPWGTMTAYYWHPGRKEIRTLGVGSVLRGVSEGTMTFDGRKTEGAFDLFQTGATRNLGLRWTFDGLDTFHDQLLEKGPRSFEVMVEWDRHRVAVASVDEPAVPKNLLLDVRLSSLLGPLATLLGNAWQTQAQKGAAEPMPASDLSLRTTFEYVPYVDAIYGRVETLDPGGTPSHAMDLYLYHHTDARVLRCLAVANSNDGDGIVYEGDITPVDNGRWLRLDLRAHRSSGVSVIEVRIDFEPPGGARFRAWSTEGKERNLLFDHVQFESKK